MDKGSVARHDVSAIIAEMDERGYCVIPGVISPEKADEARTVLDGLLAEEATEGTWRARTQRVARIAVKDPIFVELIGPSTDRIDLEGVSRRRYDLLHLDFKHCLSRFQPLRLASGLPVPVRKPALADRQRERADDVAAG